MDQYHIIDGIPPNNSKAEFYLRYNPNSDYDTLIFADALPKYPINALKLKHIIQIHDFTNINNYLREDPDNIKTIIEKHFKIYDSIRLIEAPERPLFFPYEDKKNILTKYFQSLTTDLYHLLQKQQGLNVNPKEEDFPTTAAYEKACKDLTAQLTHTYEEAHIVINVNEEVVNAFQFLWDFFKFRQTP